MEYSILVPATELKLIDTAQSGYHFFLQYKEFQPGLNWTIQNVNLFLDNQEVMYSFYFFKIQIGNCSTHEKFFILQKIYFCDPQGISIFWIRALEMFLKHWNLVYLDKKIVV